MILRSILHRHSPPWVGIRLFSINKHILDWSKRLLEGFLYGEVDESRRLTGPAILYLYPDMVTGILGTWREGRLVEGRAVDILAERCQHGLKELRTAPARHNSQVTWTLQVSIHYSVEIKCTIEYEISCPGRLG